MDEPADDGFRPLLLVVFVGAFFTVMGARLAISPAVPRIMDYFRVSNAAVGGALTLMWLTYALVQYPSGVLGDRFGERRVIIGALLLTAISSTLLGFSPSFTAFAGFVAILGASAGLYYTVATSLISKRFDNVGRVIGVHGSGGPLAGIVVPVAVTWLVTRYGWRVGVAIGTLLAVPVLVGTTAVVPSTSPERPDEPMTRRFQPGLVRSTLSRPTVAYTTLIAGFMWFGFQTFASFLPTFLIEYHTLRLGLASALFGVYFLLVGVSMIVVGELSERFGRDVLIGTVAFLGVAGVVVLVVADSVLVLVVAVGCCGIAMSLPTPVEARLMDGLTDHERSSVFGLVRTVFMLFGAFGSAVSGVVADAAGWGAAFGLLAGVLAFVFLAVLANRLLGLGV